MNIHIDAKLHTMWRHKSGVVKNEIGMKMAAFDLVICDIDFLGFQNDLDDIYVISQICMVK